MECEDNKVEHGEYIFLKKTINRILRNDQKGVLILHYKSEET